MARRNANLAGLAALGALGYKLANSGASKGQAGSSIPSRSYVPDDLSDQDGGGITALRDEEDPDYARELARAGRGPVAIGRATASAPKKPYSMTSDTVDPNIKKVTDTGDETGRLAKRYPKPAAKSAPKALSYEERLAQIPGSAPQGWTGGTGDRVTGTELGRNISNTMNALAPIGGGVGKVGAELATSGRAQRAYNTAQAERRAAEGLSDAEVADLLRRRALSEADTTGGAVGYKKGGAVKAKAKKMVVTKMGGKISSASKRADGIAQKGKTRGKLY